LVKKDDFKEDVFDSYHTLTRNDTEIKWFYEELLEISDKLGDVVNKVDELHLGIDKHINTLKSMQSSKQMLEEGGKGSHNTVERQNKIEELEESINKHQVTIELLKKQLEVSNDDYDNVIDSIIEILEQYFKIYISDYNNELVVSVKDMDFTSTDKEDVRRLATNTADFITPYRKFSTTELEELEYYYMNKNVEEYSNKVAYVEMLINSAIADKSNTNRHGNIRGRLEGTITYDTAEATNFMIISNKVFDVEKAEDEDVDELLQWLASVDVINFKDITNFYNNEIINDNI